MEPYVHQAGDRLLDYDPDGDKVPEGYVVVKRVMVVRPAMEPLTETEYERVRDACAVNPDLARHWLRMISLDTQEKIDGRRNEAAQSSQEGPLDHPARGEEGKAEDAAQEEGVKPHPHCLAEQLLEGLFKPFMEHRLALKEDIGDSLRTGVALFNEMEKAMNEWVNRDH